MLTDIFQIYYHNPILFFVVVGLTIFTVLLVLFVVGLVKMMGRGKNVKVGE